MKSPSPASNLGISDTERLHLFVSGVIDYAIYMLSPEGYVSSWNAGAQRFKGYTSEEILGEHFSRFYTDEDREAGIPRNALKTAREHGRFEAEGWRVRKDGTRFWASVVIDAIYDNQGTLIGFAKITRDITERKRTQEALRASEEQFRLLVQGVTDYAIYMLSPTGHVTNWNAGAERIKGYTQDEIIGTHFSQFYSEEDRALGLPQATLNTALKEGRFEKEGWRIRKDGTKFWAHVIVDPIRDETGELIGFAKVTRDITERREAVEALERTREALFQSQKMDSIGKLTGGVAHDFNNLLGVIVSGMELLANEVQTPAGSKILESMQRAASRGATLTQQLLAFARKQPLKQEKHHLNGIIRAFEPILRQACHETIQFNLKLESQLHPVHIDATQLEVALLNLVTNARDAMPSGGTITFVTENLYLDEGQVGQLPAGQFVKLTVEDTGTGMSQDVISRAIEPFFTTKEIGKGTGMGLSQVYGLVQQSGGEITLESDIGKGTSVSLYLPALDQPAAITSTNSQIKTSGNSKVLVVDDQPEVLEMAVELFNALGYQVFSASNGEDALETLKQTPEVEVLLTDILMPGMDGIELGKQARELIPGLKVILTSGYPAPAVSKEGSAFQDFDFLNKPYRMTEIAKLLRKTR